MGIWIRSQDRATLYNPISFGIALSNETVGYNVVADNHYRLGTYDEREQCIKIIDEISNAIIDKLPIYEMPLYEDVK